MSEDCLSINVVGPSEATGAAMPVMFFIHGGGYLFGSTATPLYNGANLARRRCIYVSANYRLGALGCLDLSSLSTSKRPIDSNLFLHDLLLALRWVHDNIADFGGDPDNVTIFGESAGAHAVAALLSVPQAGGLFHRAISQSPPNGLVGTPDDAALLAEKFVSSLNGKVSDHAAAVCSAHPRELVKTLERVLRSSMGDEPGSFCVGPTVDGELLPRHPVEAMACGTAHAIPLIIGTNVDEARIFARFMDYLPTSEPVIEKVLAQVSPAIRASLKRAYPEYPRAEACVQFGTDFAFGSMAWQIADAHSRHAPTYQYRYDYSPRTLNWAGVGATHATELLAVFDIYRTPLGAVLTAAGDRGTAIRVSKDIQRRWRAFVRHGAPGDDWPRYLAPGRAVMVFDRRSRVQFDPTRARRQAWAEFTSER